jgi:hypothetical protein
LVGSSSGADDLIMHRNHQNTATAVITQSLFLQTGPNSRTAGPGETVKADDDMFRQRTIAAVFFLHPR